MKAKKITAPDLKTAMAIAKEEVGENAIIIKEKKTATGIEIIVADEKAYYSAKETVNSAPSKTVVVKSSPSSAEEEIVYKKINRKAVSQYSESDSAKKSQNGLSELEQAKQGIASVRNDFWKDYEEQIPESFSHDSNRVDAMSEYYTGKQMSPTQSKKQRVASTTIDVPDPDRLDYAINDTKSGFDPSEIDKKFDEISGKSKAENEMLFQQLRDEIKSLQEVVESQSEPLKHIKIIKDSFLSGAKLDDTVSDKEERLIRRLDRLGMSDAIKARVVREADMNASEDESWRTALVELSNEIVTTNNDLIDNGGIFAFLGPTGVGKTTTIGKLATKYVVDNGSEDIALVTMDSFKIASFEQLKTFGKILDIPVHVVTEKNSLQEVLELVSDKRTVLIDTAGMNVDDEATIIQNKKLNAVSFDITKLLVVSASSQYELIERAWDTHSRVKLDGCILSKLDESGNLGHAISLAILKSMPIAYITDGQRIPDDIHAAEKRNIVARALEIAQKENERLAKKYREEKYAY